MTQFRRDPRTLLIIATLVFGAALTRAAAGDDCTALFARENLVAWCIVPFDRQKRSPEERAEMLERLGFKRFAYDWRAEHLPTFDREIEALKKHNVALDAVWFPAALNEDARTILDALRRYKIHTQLWVTMGDPAPQGDQEAKVTAGAAAIEPIALEAETVGCKVALYNHGGWFGEPENQLAIIDRLGMPNVGIVYNLHHGHQHLDRFVTLLQKMLPKLLALNLNGMEREGDRIGKKILPLGQGEVDLALLRTVCESGYRGPIGVLGHTMDDAEERLRDNLDGLDWIVPQLQGKRAAEKPTPRTPLGEPPVTPAGQFAGRIAEGKAEYRQPPLTAECRVKLASRDNYNILVASDTKQSGAHWELFSMAGNGALTAYLPGMKPDHVRSTKDICDGKWHDAAMLYEATRVRLLLDGEVVADRAVAHSGRAALPGGLAIGRLVEGGIGCNGEISYVRLTRGIRESVHRGDEPPLADEGTVGLWILTPTQSGNIDDKSALKNPAKVAVNPSADNAAVPPEGSTLQPVESGFSSELVDRSRGDAYMGVKVDSAGRVFVGAREAVYLFEPDGRRKFKLRQEVCRLPADSIVMGLEFRGDDLYVLADNALYLLPRGRVEFGVRPQRILWGLPLDLHVSFHCLAWGPEGDLYLTHGDPLLNYGDWNRPDHWGHWTLYGPNGEKTPYTGVGAVLRMRPDGSRVKVVAGGLRGPVGLAFDSQWNLFTNDNDHESRADLYAPARLLHVTPHVDFAWPRGWMASKSPRRFDLVEPLTADLGRGVPCDLVSYDGGALLMARWDQMAVNRYPLAARGASFSTRETPFAQARDFARPVGAAVGPDGCIFVTSLYLGGNVWSPHCYSDLVVLTPSGEQLGEWQPYVAATASAEKLWQELSHSLWQRRAIAHQEILRRGGTLLDEAVERLAREAAHSGVGLRRPDLTGRLPDSKPSNSRLHLPWLAAAGGSDGARRLLIDVAQHPDRDLRRQAIQALAEFCGHNRLGETFIAALDDREPSVVLAALGALFDCRATLPVDSIAGLAAGDDSYLRQTGAKLLAQRATFAELADLAHSTKAVDRRTAVLAAGFRLTVPPADLVPPESLPLTYNAGNAAFTLTFADAEKSIDLRVLARVGSFTTAEWWKSAPHSDEERRLFELLVAALGDVKSDVVDQAAYFLSLLNDSDAEPQIAKARQRVLATQATVHPARKVEQAWLLGPIDDDSFYLEKLAPPERGPVDLSATYAVGTRTLAWSQIGLSRTVAGAEVGRPSQAVVAESRRAAKPAPRLYLYCQLQSTARQPAVIEVSGGASAAVWHNGQAVVVASIGAPFELQPGGNDLLIRVDRPAADGVAVQFRAANNVVAALPEKVDFGLLAERLKQAATGGDQVLAELLSADWTNAVSQGDAQRGRALFGSLGCTKCHGITLDQPGGGAPNLADLRRRFTTAYVVESMLLPSKQVADPFRGTTLVLSDGRTLSGLVVNDTDEQLELLLPDAKRATIAKTEIEERAASTISPMPSGLVKTQQELRDLLAYLFSERPSPP
jgi:putative heme-binding domain-containing protein